MFINPPGLSKTSIFHPNEPVSYEWIDRITPWNPDPSVSSRKMNLFRRKPVIRENCTVINIQFEINRNKKLIKPKVIHRLSNVNQKSFTLLMIQFDKLVI